MTSRRGPVVVTGARGRLGSALVDALEARDEAATAISWSRPRYDLDGVDPGPLLERDRPAVVIHAAAWTDVDGCAREPELANRRNAGAVESLARACAVGDVGLVLVSTNEVFDGRREDGRAYTEADPPCPVNAYGHSKLAGERAARAAFGERRGLWVVRTSWLYGPPGDDFPRKILFASDERGHMELPVVTDEVGSPTYAPDLATAILDLVSAVDGGVFHLVNEGHVSRHGWAEAVLARCRPGRRTRPIAGREFPRASSPPAWGVLDAERAGREAGIRLRPWREALDDYLESIC